MTDWRRPRCQVGTDDVTQSSSEQGFFFFFIWLGPEEDSRRIPPPRPWWYFDFSFPFPVYHGLIRSPHAVTCSIRLHSRRRPEMLLSIWNIVQTDRSSSSEGEHQCLLCRHQALAPGASRYLCSQGGETPTGITNPLLVCSAATIQQNKIIPVTAYNSGLKMKW